MKILKSIFAVGAILLSAGALTSCAGDGQEAKAPLAGASKADSLMYYFGQTRALEFWQQARRDTTLQGEQARKEFMQGLRAGMEAVTKSEAYNLGVFQGVQLAVNLRQFQEDYPDVTLNRDVMLRAMTEGLKNDSAVDAKEAQSGLYSIIGQMEKEKEERDRAASIQALPAEAQKLGMAKIADHLYGKVDNPGNGTKFTPGEKVATSMSIATLGGRTLQVPLPSEVQVGARYVSPVVSEALSALTMNGSGRFLTSAQVMFGSRADRLGLQPSDMVVLTIRTGDQAKTTPVTPAGTPASVPDKDK